MSKAIAGDPVRRPGRVAILDRLRQAVADLCRTYVSLGIFNPNPDCHGGAIVATAREVEALAPFVSPVPLDLLDERLEAALDFLGVALRGDMAPAARAEVHRAAGLIVGLRRDLKGPGPAELRDDLALTAVAVAAGEVH